MVDINFDLHTTNTLNCTFLNQQEVFKKSCVIEYGQKKITHCYNENYLLNSEGSPTTNNTVQIQLHPSNYFGVVHCYRLTANDGANTIKIVGTFTGKSWHAHDICTHLLNTAQYRPFAGYLSKEIAWEYATGY